MDPESAEAAMRSRRIRSSDAWPRLARSPARQSHPRLPGHNALPTRKWCMLWAAGLRRLARKVAPPVPSRRLRTPVSNDMSPIASPLTRCVCVLGVAMCGDCCKQSMLHLDASLAALALATAAVSENVKFGLFVDI